MKRPNNLAKFCTTGACFGRTNLQENISHGNELPRNKNKKFMFFFCGRKHALFIKVITHQNFKNFPNLIKAL